MEAIEVSGLVRIILVGLLVEAIVETFKPLYDPTQREPGELADRGFALVIGLAVAVFGGFDVFDVAGVPLEHIEVIGPWPGLILTGILLSRGSNFLHGLVKAIIELPGSITDLVRAVANRSA